MDKYLSPKDMFIRSLLEQITREQRMKAQEVADIRFSEYNEIRQDYCLPKIELDDDR